MLLLSVLKDGTLVADCTRDATSTGLFDKPQANVKTLFAPLKKMPMENENMFERTKLGC